MKHSSSDVQRLVFPERNLELSWGTGVEPQPGQIVFCSIDSSGTPGQLNQYVLERVQSDLLDLPEVKELHRGFAMRGDIVFVVTIGERPADSLLRDNLTKALLELGTRIDGATLWIPLMGTGAAQIPWDKSAELILTALKKALPPHHPKSLQIILSLPPESASDDRLYKTVERLAAKAFGPVIKDADENADEVPQDETEDGTPKEPEPRRSGPPPSAHMHRDRWTTSDVLGYSLYADAIVQFIRHHETSPPLVISVQAPWGQGKTSLMRMVQRKLDPSHPDFETERRARKETLDQSSPKVRNRDVLASLTAGRETASEPQPTEFRSVWFNAWKYQSSEQIWAGLAHCILHQLVERIPTQRERELFWLRLHLHRLDPLTVRRDIHHAIFLRAIPWIAGIVAVFVALPALLPLLFPPKSAFSLGLVSSLGAWLIARFRTLEAAVEGRARQYISEPNYEGKMGFLHLVEEDLHRVFSLLVSEDRPVLVCIDDLDRCSPAKIAEIIEAINMFLGGTFQNCIFILGIDAEVVAASMEVTHEKIIEKLPERGRELGWRFMDKFVQLPFILPQPNPQERERFLDHLFRAIEGVTRPTNGDLQKRTEDFRRKLDLTQMDFGEVENDYRTLAAELAQSNPDLARVIGSEMIQKGAARFTDESDDLAEPLRANIRHLPSNPRTIKRFVNLYRFHRFISWARQAQGLPAASPEQIARWTIPLVRWPHFVRWLQLQAAPERIDGSEVRPESNGQLLTQVLESAASADTIEQWQLRLKKVGLDASWQFDKDLWAYLHESVDQPLKLGRAGAHGIW